MKFGTLPSFLIGGCLAAAVSSKLVNSGQVEDSGRVIPDHVLRVSIANVPSACETRQDVVVNGTSPGPAIRVLPGARSWIRVYNDMDNWNLSMHWHGLSQRMAPFADGTPMASQWPIPPGHFFDYEIATEIGDAGTYFYHSHVDMQALSGFGPLIVDDCGPPPLHYDDERILMFSDHFLETDDQLIADFRSQTPGPHETRGILLNGRGIALGATSVEGPVGEADGHFGSRRFDQSSTCQGCRDDDSDSEDDYPWVNDYQIKPPSGCTLPVIDVEAGKTYRFRFIGATGLSFMTMGFEDHNNLTVVQVDGSEYNAPVTTDHIQLGGGQRFDVIFQTKTAEELREAGRVTYFLQFETRDRPDVYRSYAVLRYALEYPIPPAPLNPILALPADTTNWLEYTLRPLHAEENVAPSAEEVTRRVILEADQKVDPVTGRLVFELAHMAWTDDVRNKPVLVDIYERGQAAIPNYEAALKNYGWDPATRLFPAKKDEVLEIVFQNTGSQYPGALGIVESHPFHAHGPHIYDIGSGPGKYDPEANNAKLAALKYRPVKRDTTMLYRYGNGTAAPGVPAGWRAWRTRMSQPGVWMIHCHILQHMIMGMQTVWVVGDAAQVMTVPVTVSKNYLSYGGDVYGNDTHTPPFFYYFDADDKCLAAKSFGKTT
ncbi:multicopper oxidase [Parathielavia appendiculata]|uniref:Multicopper oxidase n=1 Tax=Parathielavia appendiculata TaxID=2587402 RepID=A0AAN6U5U2_9PEZI|nr:multicopper oxidase [Parathielavia appendiculata]